MLVCFVEVMKWLGKEVEWVQVFFVMFDFECDMVDCMKIFVFWFYLSFIGLWGDIEQMCVMVSEFCIFSVCKEVGGVMGYVFDYLVGVYIYDLVGCFRFYVKDDVMVEDIVVDFCQFLVG